MQPYNMPESFNRLYTSLCGKFNNTESFPIQYVTNSSVFLSITILFHEYPVSVSLQKYEIIRKRQNNSQNLSSFCCYLKHQGHREDPLRYPPLCLTSADSDTFVISHQPSTAPQTFRKDIQSFLLFVPLYGEGMVTYSLRGGHGRSLVLRGGHGGRPTLSLPTGRGLSYSVHQLISDRVFFHLPIEGGEDGGSQSGLRVLKRRKTITVIGQNQVMRRIDTYIANFLLS